LVEAFKPQLMEVEMNKFIIQIYDYQKGIVRALNDLGAVYQKWKDDFLDAELQMAGGLHFFAERLSLNKNLLT